MPWLLVAVLAVPVSLHLLVLQVGVIALVVLVLIVQVLAVQVVRKGIVPVLQVLLAARVAKV